MNPTVEALQEELRRQANPLTNIQWVADQMDSIKSICAAAEEMIRFSPSRLFREQAEQITQVNKLALGGSIHDLIGGASSAAMMHKAMELVSRPAGFSALDLESAAFQAMGTLDYIKSAREQALNNLTSGITDYFGLTEQLRKQTLGGLSLAEYAQQYLEQSNPALSAIEAAKASLDFRMTGLGEIDWSTLAGEYDVEPEQTKAHLEEMSASIKEQTDLRGMVTAIITHTGHLQPKLQAAVLTYLLLPILFFLKKMREGLPGAIVGIMLNTSINNYVNATDCSTSPQEISKNIQQIAREAVPSPSLLIELRTVGVDELTVRLNPRAQSPELGTLAFGNVVHVIQRDGDFTLIEWKDDKGQAQLQGWVFSRHLTKFL